MRWSVTCRCCAGSWRSPAQLSVRFIRPVPIERPLVARAELTRQEGSRWYVDATLRLAAGGAELASAQGILVARDRGHFARHQAWLADQDAREEMAQ